MDQRVVLYAAAMLLAAGWGGAASSEDTAPTPFDPVGCNGDGNEIRIIVKNVKRSVGLMAADLYPDDENGFLKGEHRITQVRFAAKAPVTTFCITAPEPSSYAIAVYHDENANQRFDKQVLGMPAEPYGVSNDPPMRFGPPSVKEALFEVAADGATVVIELRN